MGRVGSVRRFDSKAWWSTTRRFAGSCASMTCSPRFVAATTTIDSDHDQPIFPNLAEGLTPDGPDQLWVADITYVPVIGGFVYVAMVLDAWSRRVVGYAISRSINIRLRWSMQEIRRLANRLAQRRIEPHASSRGHVGDAPTKLPPNKHDLRLIRNCDVTAGIRISARNYRVHGGRRSG